MKGHDTFRQAVDRLSRVDARRGRGRRQARSHEIDVFAYHQANSRILAAVGDRLGLDPRAGGRLHRALRQHIGGDDSARASRGSGERACSGPASRVLLAAFGGGLTWAATVVEWGATAMEVATMREGCAIVTGSARGIGAATATASRRRAGRWSSTTAAMPTPPPRCVERIEAAGGRALAVKADVTDPSRGRPALRARRGGARPRAGARQQRGHARRRPGAAARRRGRGTSVLDTNLSAAFHTTRRALRPMLRGRFGRIVNVASIVGPRANAGQSNYAASKAGLIGMTKTVAVEVARRGITVNAVAPGLVETRLTEGIAERRSPTRSRRGGPEPRRRWPPASASSPPRRPRT